MNSRPARLLLDPPALLGLNIAVLGFLFQLYFTQTLGRPLIGRTAAESPGISLGVVMLALLLLTFWKRDWASTKVRAMLAPFLGACVGLAIVSAPIMTVTKMEFNRASGRTVVQNVVLMPGPARPTGTLVVSNASVNPAPDQQNSEAVSENTVKGEGWMSIQMDTHRGSPLLWSALVIAPLLGLAGYRRPVQTVPYSEPPAEASHIDSRSHV